MNELQFDGALLQDLDSFIECYQFIDDKQIYTNGSELIPVFRIKQWFEYNNLQQEIARLNKIIDEALRFIKLHDLYHPANEFILLNILQGNDKKVDELTKAIIKAQEKN